jgi:hypothetical protein
MLEKMMRLALLTVTTCVWALPAMAQVTAKDYWAHLQATTGAKGQAEEQADGLRIRGMVVEGQGARVELPLLLLTETSQGVEMRGPDGALVGLDEWMFDGATYARAEFRVDMPDQVILISGEDVSRLRYDFTTPKQVITLTGLEGTAVAGNSFVVTMVDVNGHVAPLAGANEFVAKAGQMELAQVVATGPDTRNFRLSLSDVAATAQYNMPEAALVDDLSAAESIAAGMLIDLRVSAGKGQASLAEEKSDEMTVATVGMGAALLDLGMGPKGLALDQSVKGLTLAVDHQTDDPEDDPAVISVGNMDYRVTMAAPIEALDDMERQDGAFPEGVSMGVELGLADVLMSIGPKETPLVDFALTTGAAKLAINDEAMDMSTKIAGLDVQGDMGDLGERVGMTLAEAGFALQFPVNTLYEPAPFRLSYKTIGLNLSDSIWNLMDSGQLFPRDPIDIDFAMDNVVTLRAPLQEFDQYDVDDGDVPLELNAVKLTTLLLSGLGVKVTGSGEAALDYSQVESSNGIPGGNGKFSFDLLGINGLFDKLEQGGLLSSDELMGARMGLMMFAKSAGEGDHMTSEAELRDGRFYLNGMLMR